MDTSRRAVEEFLAGSVGGACGVAVGHPFDTVKVRLQLSDARLSVGAVLASVLRSHGPAGLFRGMASPLLTDALSSAVVFGSFYQAGVQLFGAADVAQLSFAQAFAAGCLAGVPGGLLLCPIELVKIKLQSPHSPFRGPVHVVAHTLRSEGVAGLFRGIGPTLVRDIPSYGVYFSVYQHCKKLLDHADPATNAIISGGVAGTACWAVCYPADVIKSRMQAQSKTATADVYFRGFTHCLRHTVATAGYRSLVQGITPTLVRAFPVNAAIFGSYELAISFLRLVE